jgi:hypothetical protein
LVSDDCFASFHSVLYFILCPRLYFIVCPREGLKGEPRVSAEQVIDERAEAKAPDYHRQRGYQEDCLKHVRRKTESGVNQQCGG